MALWSAALAIFLGGAVAWTATGLFDVAYFVAALVAALSLQFLLLRVNRNLPRLAVPLWALLGWWVQVGYPGGGILWPALSLAAAFWGVAWWDARDGDPGPGVRALLWVGYLLPVAGVVAGVMPIWCLIVLFPAPLLLRLSHNLIFQAALLLELFLITAYLIQGLIR